MTVDELMIQAAAARHPVLVNTDDGRTRTATLVCWPNPKPGRRKRGCKAQVIVAGHWLSVPTANVRLLEAPVNVTPCLRVRTHDGNRSTLEDVTVDRDFALDLAEARRDMGLDVTLDVPKDTA